MSVIGDKEGGTFSDITGERRERGYPFALTSDISLSNNVRPNSLVMIS